MGRCLPHLSARRATWLVGLALVLACPPVRAASPDDPASRALAAVGEGALALRTGSLVAACDAFARAVRFTPTWAMARLEYARCLRLLGDPRGEAGAQLDAALETLSDRAAPWTERGHQAEDRGALDAACEAYRRAESLAPGDAEAQAGVVRCATIDQGLTTLERVRRASRGSPALLAAWWRVAEAAEALGLYDEAELALRYLVDHSAAPKRAAVALADFGARHGRHAAVQRARQVLGF